MISREEPPQPAIAHSKTVEAIIRNWVLYPAKIDCMTIGTVSPVGLIGATCSLAIRFDGIKPFFASWLLHPHRSWRSEGVDLLALAPNQTRNRNFWALTIGWLQNHERGCVRSADYKKFPARSPNSRFVAEI